ncbi:similar to RIKEN cDNA 9930022N03 gene (predicted) [Rattus norvegicus]|uniref:Similar to RIKEN cDNA 9930022N03 gene (Predicted) n=1 Tax=Rattus norvegicus TaxID=10116 RepID=A6KS34_RAT|nr:similar to RIKEN cDNA 9930022N03 gene (predicted) [Rattus norvegicus]
MGSYYWSQDTCISLPSESTTRA